MLIFSILIVTQISSAQLISYPASCYGDTETTNFEACRDLNGRRLRTVNEAKR